MSSILRRIGLYEPLRSLNRNFRRGKALRVLDRAEVRNWRSAGRPVPIPAAMKRECIREYARKWNLKVLVETGTFEGDTCFALRSVFREIHSIEHCKELYERAAHALGHLKHVHLHFGPSEALLPKISVSVDLPTLYWLDAHYCFGPEPKGESHTPIMAELMCLLAMPPACNVILIDDARLFDGNKGYPKIGEIQELVEVARPSATLSILNDIIRICPV